MTFLALLFIWLWPLAILGSTAMTHVTVAAAQMTSGPAKQENVDTATRLVEEAVRRGAEFVALPELFNCLAEPDVISSGSEAVPGPTSKAIGGRDQIFEIDTIVCNKRNKKFM